MLIWRKSRKLSRGPVRELRLTDARSRVVSRRSRGMVVWNVLSIPFRIWLACWNWLMESKPSGYYRVRR
jgi:hypothetical protein